MSAERAREVLLQQVMSHDWYKQQSKLLKDVSAKVSNEKYLGTLNSFLLNLDNSEFVKFDNIDLKKIKSLNSNSKEKGYLFEINTKVSTDYIQLNKNYLIKLGSYGLFNRLNLLNNIESNSD